MNTLEQEYDISLPRRMQIEFSQVVQAETDRVGLEMTAPQIYALLQREYLQANTPYALVSHRLQEENGNSSVEVEVSGKGQGDPTALIDAGTLKTTLGEHFGVINAANLRRAHALLESGKAKGKIVLEGF